jgi:tetratricopeptide (TPR) repeat protein
MTEAMTTYWKARGFLSEGRRFLNRALEHVVIPDEARARLLRRAASFAIEQNDYDSARSFNAECRAIFEELNNLSGVAETAFNVGLIEQRLGNNDRALANYDEATLAFRAANNDSGQAAAIHNVVLLLVALDDLDAAQARIDDAGTGLSSALDPVLAAHYTALRGRVAYKRGDVAAAEPLFRHALAVQSDLGDRRDRAVLQSELAFVLVHLGRYTEAESAARDCIRIGIDMQSSSLLILGFEALCEIAFEQTRYEEAARTYALATTLREAEGFGAATVRDLTPIAHALRENLGSRYDDIVREVRAAGAGAATTDAARLIMADAL